MKQSECEYASEHFTSMKGFIGVGIGGATGARAP